MFGAEDLFEPIRVVKYCNKNDVESFLGCPIDKMRFLVKKEYESLIRKADYYDLKNNIPHYIDELRVPYKDLHIVLRSYRNDFEYTFTIINKYFDKDNMTSEMREKMIKYILKYIKILHYVDVLETAKVTIEKYKEKYGTLFKGICSGTIAEILKEVATVTDVYYNPNNQEVEEFERYLFYPEALSKRNTYGYFDYCIEGFRWKIMFDDYNVLVYFVKSQYVNP